MIFKLLNIQIIPNNLCTVTKQPKVASNEETLPMVFSTSSPNIGIIKQLLQVIPNLKRTVTFQKTSWHKRKRNTTKGKKYGEIIENSTSCAEVPHETSNLVISRWYLSSNGNEMNQNQNRMCGAWKDIGFAHEICRFQSRLMTTSPWSSSMHKRLMIL